MRYVVVDIYDLISYLTYRLGASIKLVDLGRDDLKYCATIVASVQPCIDVFQDRRHRSGGKQQSIQAKITVRYLWY